MTDNTNKNLYGICNSQPSMYQTGNEKEIAARWDRKANLWDQQLKDNNNHLNQDNAYQNFLELSKSVILNSQWDACKLIDVGCGTGLVAKALAPYCHSIMGIDISAEMLKQAEAKKIPGACFRQHSIFGLPENMLGQYDLIVSRGVLLSHYSKTVSVDIMSAIYSLCRDSQSIAILDFLNRNVGTGYNHIPNNKNYFTKDEIEALAISAGFTCCKFVGYNQQRTLLTVLSTT